MDVEDRRRYFIIASVILEIVQPLLRSRLENDYKDGHSNSGNWFCCAGMEERKINSYKLGQDIFYLHHQFNLKSVLNIGLIGEITDVALMDDGRLVMCLTDQCRLLICNIDGSQVGTIPCCVTAINNSTLAVTVYYPVGNHGIEIYDVNNKHKLKYIPVPRMVYIFDITMINDKLVVGADSGLVVVDYQKGEIVQNIGTNCQPWEIYASDNRIFYREYMQSNKILYWYSFIDDKMHTLTFASIPCSMTSLGDGSLYVICTDGCIQHVSSNGKQFRTLKTNQSQFFNDCPYIRYNSKQKIMVTYNVKTENAQILQEIEV
ncbi:uncharacterized protein LOC127720478 isoform X2 [Mytilus californianus]|uniref:uncharacterized protein LOC127720478 isoform X2 n=1 Tax=Mytilus californianus TaxID=6549 RepID=UPI00224871EC|nr:uncharacterized protein LOC127720478 isoform X2 [Mytilus californianus]